MTFGLDIGSSGVRCLYRAGKSLRGRRAPACYVVLPGGTDERLLLQRAMIPFSTCEGSYVVFGDNALELARAMKLPLIPVFPEGRLPIEDPIGRQVAATVIESLLPTQGAVAGSSLMVVPEDVSRFAERVLALRGVKCESLHAGTASVLAELNDCQLTGAGLCVGANLTSLGIAVHGQPVAELTFPRGLAGVDEVFAKSRGRYFFDAEGNRYLDVRQVSRWRESAQVDLTAPEGDDQDLLRSLIREWLLAAMSEFAQRLEATRAGRASRGVSVMTLTGGPARMAGFDVLVADAMRRAQLPLRILEIRTANNDDYTLARGALIAAELEQKVATRKVA
jgi:hypothetical protein